MPSKGKKSKSSRKASKKSTKVDQNDHGSVKSTVSQPQDQSEPRQESHPQGIGETSQNTESVPRTGEGPSSQATTTWPSNLAQQGQMTSRTIDIPEELMARGSYSEILLKAAEFIGMDPSQVRYLSKLDELEAYTKSLCPGRAKMASQGFVVSWIQSKHPFFMEFEYTFDNPKTTRYWLRSANDASGVTMADLIMSQAADIKQVDDIREFEISKLESEIRESLTTPNLDESHYRSLALRKYDKLVEQNMLQNAKWLQEKGCTKENIHDLDFNDMMTLISMANQGALNLTDLGMTLPHPPKHARKTTAAELQKALPGPPQFLQRLEQEAAAVQKGVDADDATKSATLMRNEQKTVSQVVKDDEIEEALKDDEYEKASSKDEGESENSDKHVVAESEDPKEDSEKKTRQNEKDNAQSNNSQDNKDPERKTKAQKGNVRRRKIAKAKKWAQAVQGGAATAESAASQRHTEDKTRDEDEFASASSLAPYLVHGQTSPASQSAWISPHPHPNISSSNIAASNVVSSSIEASRVESSTSPQHASPEERVSSGPLGLPQDQSIIAPQQRSPFGQQGGFSITTTTPPSDGNDQGDWTVIRRSRHQRGARSVNEAELRRWNEHGAQIALDDLRAAPAPKSLQQVRQEAQERREAAQQSSEAARRTRRDSVQLIRRRIAAARPSAAATADETPASRAPPPPASQSPAEARPGPDARASEQRDSLRPHPPPTSSASEDGGKNETARSQCTATGPHSPPSAPLPATQVRPETTTTSEGASPTTSTRVRSQTDVGQSSSSGAVPGESARRTARHSASRRQRRAISQLSPVREVETSRFEQPVSTVVASTTTSGDSPANATGSGMGNNATITDEAPVNRTARRSASVPPRPASLSPSSVVSRTANLGDGGIEAANVVALADTITPKVRGPARELHTYAPWATNLPWLYVDESLPLAHAQRVLPGVVAFLRPPPCRPYSLLGEGAERDALPGAVLVSQQQHHQFAGRLGISFPEAVVQEERSRVLLRPHAVPFLDLRADPAHPDWLPATKLCEYQAVEMAGLDVWRSDRAFHPCALPRCRVPCIDHDTTTHICPGCGPMAGVRYCSLAHLLEDCGHHWSQCGASPATSTVPRPAYVDATSLPPRYHDMVPAIVDVGGANSAARHRQRAYAMLNGGQYTLFGGSGGGRSNGSSDEGTDFVLPRTVEWPTSRVDAVTAARYAARIERLLNIALHDQTKGAALRLLHGLVRMALRLSASDSAAATRDEKVLRDQFRDEFGWDAERLASPHDPCECHWLGGLSPLGSSGAEAADEEAREAGEEEPSTLHSLPLLLLRRREICSAPGCRQLTRATGVTFRGGAGGVREIVRRLEARSWMLRVWRRRHPTVRSWRDRLEGRGFAGAGVPIGPAFSPLRPVMGEGWQGRGSGDDVGGWSEVE